MTKTTSLPRLTGNVTPSDETAAVCRLRIKRFGLNVLARAWGLDSHSVARCGASATLHALTLAAIEEGLTMSDTELEVVEGAMKTPPLKTAAARRASP